MRGLNKSTLFHRKSKSNLSGRNNSLEDSSTLHARKWSTSSTVSQTSSTTSSHDRLYDPLSLHPPLSLNTSPHIIPEYEEDMYREDEERESRFFNQRHHAEEHIQDSAEYSPIKGHNCYFVRPMGGKPYVYDQGVQWPLKDWQAIPPGLAELDSSAASSPAESPTRPMNHRRRPTNWMNDRDALLKRGDWKRRGIVFHLDNEDEEQQEQHFELPEL
ncbi:Cytochrome oxidase assembly [Hypoxylon texense]